ncbi:hypothetical protein GGX14DRAFT_644607 [Mycena pura]|uniref:Uncharacterized protein n=1 Tax=Mycena pura TaxID=153505 RepID=A0AAD6VC40_9AGAR|nr:hypothetical protein GGX14DRAFT_644607 [Mycena pura]
MSSAQEAFVIQVGSVFGSVGGGYQFLPNYIFSAPNGSVVSFIFTGSPGNHTVTQSSLTTPCEPLAGGFDSGWIFVLNELLTPPIWNLTVTDDREPIVFHCKQDIPGSHCSAGMVGAINIGDFDSLDALTSAAAKATHAGQQQGGLSGVGAVATAFPSIPAGATLLNAFAGSPVLQSAPSATAGVPSSTSPPRSSNFNTQMSFTSIPSSSVSTFDVPVPSSSSKDSFPRTALIVGVVSPVIAVLIALLLLLVWRRRRRLRRHDSNTQVDPLINNGPSAASRLPSKAALNLEIRLAHEQLRDVEGKLRAQPSSRGAQDSGDDVGRLRERVVELTAEVERLRLLGAEAPPAYSIG